MKVGCPSCGYTASITAFANEADAREALALAMRLPAPLAKLLMQYLVLFRPHKQLLRWTRVKNLLADLLTCIEGGQVERHGRAWVAPLPLWKDGLEAVLARQESLTLPLKDHAYLYQIIAGMANKDEAQQEARQEQQRQQATTERRGMQSAATVAAKAAKTEQGRTRSRALVAQFKPGLKPSETTHNTDLNGEEPCPE